MSIVYDPSKLLSKIVPERKLKKLVTNNLTVKRAALAHLMDFEGLSKKRATEVALQVVKEYKARVKAEARGAKADLKKSLAKDPRQLINRVQNEVVLQIKEQIKTKYKGEFYRWLPSDANEPDPLHQLKYGKTFQVGVGEMPGDRYGCRCGMEILVDQTILKLG